MNKTIELDCAPGTPRPSTYIGDVVAGTPLEHLPAAHPDATVSRFFGNWIWSFPMISDSDWTDKIRPIIQPRIKALYESGRIRYGRW